MSSADQAKDAGAGIPDEHVKPSESTTAPTKPQDTNVGDVPDPDEDDLDDLDGTEPSLRQGEGFILVNLMMLTRTDRHAQRLLCSQS